MAINHTIDDKIKKENQKINFTPSLQKIEEEESLVDIVNLKQNTAPKIQKSTKQNNKQVQVSDRFNNATQNRLPDVSI